MSVVIEHVLRVGASEEGVEEDAILVPVGAAHRFKVLGVRGSRSEHAQIEGQADLGGGADAPRRSDAEAVRQ